MSTGRPPGIHRASAHRPSFSPQKLCFLNLHVYWFFPDFGSHFASLLERCSWFWHPFFEHRYFTDICIDFALILYPWSCEKTILTLYSSQKTRNRRFRNFVDLSLSLDIVVASFWDHFLISFHKFSIPICALIFGCPFMEIGSQKGPAREPGHRQKSILFTTFSEHRSLDAFWSTFGTHWAPFSLPSVRFWLHFGRFG